MWIPQSLYKLLPALYVLVGVSLLAMFGITGIGAMSALLFFAAATLTTIWRFTHREAAPTQADKAREAWAERKARSTQNMPL